MQKTKHLLLKNFIFLAVLIFLPFQQLFVKLFNNQRLLFFDEIVVFLSGIIFLFFFMYSLKIKRSICKIVVCMACFVCIGFVSGISNDNNLLITFLGVFDYLKYFILIPITVFLGFREIISVKKIYFCISWLAVLLCVFAVIQELAFFCGLANENIGVDWHDVRYGLMRTPSLIGHPNAFGLYVLLFFIFETTLKRKMDAKSYIYFLGIILSISRMVWIALLIYLFIFFRRKIKRNILFFGGMVMFICAILYPFLMNKTINEVTNQKNVRAYVYSKSYELLKQNVLIGLGPGMYGGVVSFRFSSPVYNEFDIKWYNYLSSFRSLDAFWPQIFVEVGILGGIVFIVFLFYLSYIAKKESRNSCSVFRKNMLEACFFIPIVIALYLFGSGLNMTHILMTYSIFYGLLLGIEKNENITNK